MVVLSNLVMRLKLQVHFVDGFVLCKLGILWGLPFSGDFPSSCPHLCDDFPEPTVHLNRHHTNIQFLSLQNEVGASSKATKPLEKNICKFLLNQLFLPLHVLESTDLRNVLFLWAALTWILFVYGLVFVHTLKVGFYFYSDKASSLLSSSNDESFPTKSLEFLWLLQVWVWF